MEYQRIFCDTLKSFVTIFPPVFLFNYLEYPHSQVNISEPLVAIEIRLLRKIVPTNGVDILA